MGGYRPRLTHDMFAALTVAETERIVGRAFRVAALYQYGASSPVAQQPQRAERFREAMDELIDALPVIEVPAAGGAA